MKKEILRYLGYQSTFATAETEKLIDECIELVVSSASPKYVYQEVATSTLFSILKNEIYQDFLVGCESCLLMAVSLGSEIDRLINYYQKVDLLKSVVIDATANAYIEEYAFQYEQKLPYSALTDRFCPGYQKTDLKDNELILDFLDAKRKLRIAVKNGLMIPLKTMVGIIGIGSGYHRTCDDCLLHGDCEYVRRGLYCYKK